MAAPQDLRAQTIEAINQIVDPCSAGIGAPTGLLDMGLVKEVEIKDGNVAVELLTTSPFCLYVGHFEEEVARRVGALPWVRTVTVTVAHRTMWDESLMSEAARAQLAQKHRRPRANIPAGRSGLGGAP